MPLAGVFALDRAADARRTAALRPSLLYLIFLGAVGLGLVADSLAQLCRANVPLRKSLLGFALLATVPAQQFVQVTQGSAAGVTDTLLSGS